MHTHQYPWHSPDLDLAVKDLLKHRHIHTAHTASTNSALIELVVSHALAQDLPHLFTTDTQSAGKGQHGRAWANGAGNVFLSLYVPMTNAKNTPNPLSLGRLSGVLSLLIGVQICQLPSIAKYNECAATQNLTAKNLAKIGVKWANDIGYYQQKTFHKLAGILIEPVFCQQAKSLVGVVIGVGLNVRTTPALKSTHAMPYFATSLSEILANSGIACPSAHEMYAPLTQLLALALARCNTLTHDDSQMTAFITEFNALHLLHNQPIALHGAPHTPSDAQIGTCTGINHDGALLFAKDGVQTPIFAGSVQLV
ncbi:hypothetical protein B0181_03175 [Moraxella caviae]|uniref:BPL/LPL catalytic domain-containing protein n=1 Tax=Moraxella caviae TaxID=34060 RepID=A0A1T0A6A7_9GAMM|nr:biotin--[acetyl-CoA-carboxylase] ligase [Moraxella caviae]OOR91322.1 hypothetical protein B0181_03175 [Moraxella caviae]